MKRIWFEMLRRWRELDWMPPFPNLDRHIEHIAGGCAMVLFFLALGAQWDIAALTVTLITLTIEGTTALVKGNLRDSSFDFVQYQAHWMLFFLHYNLTIFAAMYFILWLAAYTYMLIERW